MNADQTITTVPCEDDPTSDCYDFVDDSYDASLNVFAITNAWWYEDFPNIDFDILHLGVPEVSTAAEEFCSLFTDTCGDWEGGVSCEVWYNAADMGNPADTSGASQACYDYHLGVAAADTSADPANGSYSVHCEHAAGVSVCVDGSTEPTAAEAFCSLFTDTCGAWEGSATCEDWYNAADVGASTDTSGATQGCYDYHLSVAAGDSAADPANGVYSTHCEHAAGLAVCVDPEPTAAEAFCSLFTDTCGAWEGSATCEDWYNAADAGNEGDTSGATQGCYDYHLSVAAGDTTADPANGSYSAHCDHAAGAAPCQ
jgi:hypothetical protein